MTQNHIRPRVAVDDIIDDFTRGPWQPRTPARPEDGRNAEVVLPQFRPSPVIALDVPVKIVAAVLSVLIPLNIAAIVQGDATTFAISSITSIAVLANLVPAAIAAAIPSIRILFTTYHVTEDGLRTETRLFSKEAKTVRWEKITALIERQTLFDRIFGLRRLKVVAYGERGANLNLVGLRDWRPLRDRIAIRMRDAATVDRLFGND